jgi:hypothetical protein
LEDLDRDTVVDKAGLEEHIADLVAFDLVDIPVDKENNLLAAVDRLQEEYIDFAVVDIVDTAHMDQVDLRNYY